MFLVVPSAFAVTFDAATDGGFTTATSRTFSHTVAVQDDRMLFVHTVGDTASDVITGVTYDGVAMTKLGPSQKFTDRYVSVWYLENPSTGANNVVISASASKVIGGFAMSYYDVASGIDAFNSGSDTATINHNVTTTHNASTYLVVMGRDGAGGRTYTAGTNAVLRLDGTGVGFFGLDSNELEAGTSTFQSWTTNTAVGSGYFVMGIKSPAAPATPYFSVTAKDADTTATLYNITITLENGTTYTNTSNSIVYTPFNDSSLQNFTVSVDNYFNISYINWNTSFDLQSNLTQYPLVYVYDRWTNASVNASVVIDGTTYYSGTSGVYVQYNNSQLTQISLNNYFSSNVTHNYLNSNDLNTSIFQAEVRFNATEVITGNYVSPANFTIDGVTKGVDEPFYLSLGDYNVTFSKSGWFDKTIEFSTYSGVSGMTEVDYNPSGTCSLVLAPVCTVKNDGTTIDSTNACFASKVVDVVGYFSGTCASNGLTGGVDLAVNFTETITSVSDSVINITASNILSGASINTFSINISNNNYSYSEVYQTTIGYINVPVLQNVEFNISINATGYALSNVTLTPNVSLYNYTFQLYTTNSILFMLYDEVTGELLNGTNMTLQIIGSYQALNRTTDNGTLYVDLLTPDGYEIRYFSSTIDDYKLRSYFTDVTSQSFQQIDLYALNDTSTAITSAAITFIVYDQDLDPVEDMRVTVSRYYIDENAFLQVFSRNTNTAGQAVGTFETIDAFYQYQVKQGDTIYYTSSSAGTQFTGTQTIPIYINLNTITYDTIQTFDSIPATLRYVNTSATTGYVQYNWSYSTSLPVCLYVDEVTAFGSGFSSSTCTSGATGSIQIAINTSSLTKDYVAKGLINYNAQGYQVHDTLSFTVNLTQAVAGDSWKDIATFIALFALIISWFMGLRYPTVSILSMSVVFVILTIPPLRLIAITTSVALWVVAIGILLLIKASRSQ